MNNTTYPPDTPMTRTPGIIRNLDLVQALLNTTLDDTQLQTLLNYTNELTTATDRVLKTLNKLTTHLPTLPQTNLTQHLENLLNNPHQHPGLTTTTRQLLKTTKATTNQEPLHLEHQPAQITIIWPTGDNTRPTWIITPAHTTNHEPLPYPLINLTTQLTGLAGTTIKKHYHLAHQLHQDLNLSYKESPTPEMAHPSNAPHTQTKTEQ